MSEKLLKFGDRDGRKNRRVIDAPGPVKRAEIDRRHEDLTWIPLFSHAVAQDVNRALRNCDILEFPAGQSVLVPGQTNACVYITLSGELAAHLDYALTPEASIPIPPGECIGELSAIDGKPVSILVTTVTDARILRIPQDIFWGELLVMPRVAANLRIMLSTRVRRTNEMTLKAQKEQLELIHLKKELNLAKQLQASMLPLQQPLFDERRDIEVCGFMEPASNVGGDLFDAFFVRDNRLFFCIGDVSGHGIVSALFMARTIGLVRVLAMGTPDPHKLLTQLNERLCLGNETNVFVTLFCGLLEVDTGRLVYSNAGHCAPMLNRKGQTNILALPKGPLVGAFAGARYQSLELTLGIGDTLFCYTDGVTESHNPRSEEFSEKRCVELIDRIGSQPIRQLLESVRREVTAFSETQVLEDDCTMLALRRLTQ
jgi:sigma-B regulation protein RsbU (phosphoserine phosphatase)